MEQLKSFATCHVCGHQAVDHLRTYSHCVSCLHVEDRTVSEQAIPDWAQDEYKKISRYFDFQFARLNGGAKKIKEEHGIQIERKERIQKMPEMRMEGI
jgi:hypothetical protein